MTGSTSPLIIPVIKSRRMGWVGHVARTGGRMETYRVLLEMAEEKCSPRRPMCSWKDNIKINLQQVG
jgi:hypothetical protein